MNARQRARFMLFSFFICLGWLYLVLAILTLTLP